MAENKMLREALDALAQGQQGRARDLLTRLLRADQANPNYWLYMSAVVETPKERIYCLQNVLRLDPENRQARLGLVIQGASSPGADSHPAQIVRRAWQVPEADKFSLSLGKKLIRSIALAGAGILLVGLLLMGVLGPRLPFGGIFGAPRLTVTPLFLAQLASPTLLPTNTPYQVTPSPTFTGPKPLWMLLEATYTPTPLYVNTPHPISEAFRAGLRSLNNENYSEMLHYMQQAAREEPEAADLSYYVGEAYRLLGEPDQALVAYEGSITANSQFAPAYLSRALVNKSLAQMDNVEVDLISALDADPNLVEAYLELAALQIGMGEMEMALDTLTPVYTLAPGSPLLFQYQAWALLELGNVEAALAAAEKAYALDRTSLPVHLILGRAYLQNGNPVKANIFLNTYLSYVDDDIEAWAANGQASYELGDFAAARDSLTKVLEFDGESYQALLYRGLAYLELDEGQLAINDLFEARNMNHESFTASLGLGRALLMTKRILDAANQFTGAEKLAANDSQLAEVFFWRAVAREALGDYKNAASDWGALLDLPPSAASPSWRDIAQEKLILMSPTPTITSTPKPPTATPSPTKSPTPTSTNTLPPPSTFSPPP